MTTLLASDDWGAVFPALGAVLAAFIAVGGAWWTYRAGKNQAEKLRIAQEEQTRKLAEQGANVDQRKLDQEAFRIFQQEYQAQRATDLARLQSTEARLTATEDRLRTAEESQRASEARARRFSEYLQETWIYVERLKASMREHNVPVDPAPPNLERFPWREWDEGPPSPRLHSAE